MAPNMENLIAEVSFKTSRSGGSGGQHVNKVSTKVELDFDVLESKVLTDEEKALISEKLASRLTSDGILQVISHSERSQLRNKKVALEKFQELIQACFVVPKKRKPSKVPRRVKEKRLLTKKMKAEIKKLRRKDF
jgi:ribosome-associated protein